MANNSRTSKIDRNREKVIQDRLQLLLTRMLQDEDNKYCVDCDAKGNKLNIHNKLISISHSLLSFGPNLTSNQKHCEYIN